MSEYISKKRAKDLMGCCLASAKASYKAAKDEFTKARFGDYISTIQAMIDVVGAVEAADIEPVKHGYWTLSNLYARCSECSVAYDLDTFQRLIPMNENVPRHCSYCGARMDGEPND